MASITQKMFHKKYKCLIPNIIQEENLSDPDL